MALILLFACSLSAHAVYVADVGDGTGAASDGPPPPALTAEGTLILSEIVDHADDTASFVELRNASSDPLTLDGSWRLRRYTSSAPVESGLPALDVPPGGTVVIAADQTGFSDAFGVSPDGVSAIATGNGDDAYALIRDGEVVDLFGEESVDGTDTPWDYTNGVAARNGSVTVGSTTWLAEEWTLTPGTDAATPGS